MLSSAVRAVNKVAEAALLSTFAAAYSQASSNSSTSLPHRLRPKMWLQTLKRREAFVPALRTKEFCRHRSLLFLS